MDDKRLERIEKKLDDGNDHLATIDITLAKQSVILEEHVKRSNMLEEKMVPIERHIVVVNAILKLAGALSGIGGSLHLILKYIMKVY